MSFLLPAETNLPFPRLAKLGGPILAICHVLASLPGFMREMIRAIQFVQISERGEQQKPRNRGVRKPRRFVPALCPPVEALESRVLLSGYVVTNLADDGSTGSLRWAVLQANSNSGTSSSPDIISFASGLSGTITLAIGQLELTAGDTTIQGPGAGTLAISGNQLSRVFQVDGAVTATISGLAIIKGQDTSGFGGGGILNNGTLTVTNATLSDDSAPGPQFQWWRRHLQ